MTKLTPRQRQALTFYQQYTAHHGYPPSVRELGRALGLRSTSTAHSHLEALVRKGYLERWVPGHPRSVVPAGLTEETRRMRDALERIRLLSAPGHRNRDELEQDLGMVNDEARAALGLGA